MSTFEEKAAGVDAKLDNLDKMLKEQSARPNGDSELVNELESLADRVLNWSTSIGEISGALRVASRRIAKLQEANDELGTACRERGNRIADLERRSECANAVFTEPRPEDAERIADLEKMAREDMLESQRLRAEQGGRIAELESELAIARTRGHLLADAVLRAAEERDGAKAQIVELEKDLADVGGISAHTWKVTAEAHAAARAKESVEYAKRFSKLEAELETSKQALADERVSRQLDDQALHAAVERAKAAESEAGGAWKEWRAMVAERDAARAQTEIAGRDGISMRISVLEGRTIDGWRAYAIDAGRLAASRLEALIKANARVDLLETQKAAWKDRADCELRCRLANEAEMHKHVCAQTPDPAFEARKRQAAKTIRHWIDDTAYFGPRMRLVGEEIADLLESLPAPPPITNVAPVRNEAFEARRQKAALAAKAICAWSSGESYSWGETVLAFVESCTAPSAPAPRQVTEEARNMARFVRDLATASWATDWGKGQINRAADLLDGGEGAVAK